MAVIAVRRPRSTRMQIIDLLNEDWRRCVVDHPHRAQQWAARHGVLSNCRDLADVLAAVRQSPDEALFTLLAENANGDELAGRVVLQAMLGKLVRMAATDPKADVDDYVSAMWCHIRDYPLPRRPNKIAANLSLDTLKAVRAEHSGKRCDPETAAVAPGPGLNDLLEEHLARSVADHNAATAALSADSVLQTAGRLGLIDRPTHAVLRSVYSDGLSGIDAAQRHHTSPAMIRNRCSRAVRRLAEHSETLAEAA